MLSGPAPHVGSDGQLSGSPASDATAKIEQELQEARAAGKNSDLARAEKLFAQAEQDSRKAHYVAGQATALAGLGSCDMAHFAFRRALSRYLVAQDLARPLNNALLSGKLAISIASVYIALNNPPLAEAELREGIRLLQQAKDQKTVPQLITASILLAQLRFDERDDKGWRAAIEEAIKQAHQLGDRDTEAMAWEYRGYYCLRRGRYEEARHDLDTALGLAEAEDKALVQVVRSVVLFKLNRAQEALALLDSTLAKHDPSLTLMFAHEVLDWRGRMLETLGRDDDALAAFRQATQLADRWRASALPGDVSSTNTLSYPVLQSVYVDHYQLAAKLALARRSSALAREALEVVARQRAANLREEAALSLQRQQRLPAEYYELLTQLKATQAQALAAPGGSSESSASQIRVRLAEIEDKVGLPAAEFSRDGERNLHQKSLRDIQQCLGTEDVLLSFALGEEGSTVTFLWATTRDSVTVYGLASKERLEHAGQYFRDAVRMGTHVEEKGQALRRELFGQLPPAILAKQHWLLALDGELLDSIPWAALPADANHADPLIAHRDIRLLPSELLLAERQRTPRGEGFVAVGDPVYNKADRRRKPAVYKAASNGAPTTLVVPRLVGSGEEVAKSARAWNSSAETVLTGSLATSEDFQKALDSRKPALIHFAVHILSPEKSPEQAALALSLASNGLPELLTEEVVSTLRVPGSIVVLSGCASEAGRVVPGAGLVGLSRAWLLAGASAVIVSAWPTPDDTGHFFEVYYGQLAKLRTRSIPLVESAAMALEQAQQTMRKEGGFRGSPAFWAAYAMISKN